MNSKYLIAAAAIALTGPAAAQSLQDPYGFVFGGVTLEGNADFDGLIGGNPNSVDTDFDTGHDDDPNVAARRELRLWIKPGVRAAGVEAATDWCDCCQQLCTHLFPQCG